MAAFFALFLLVNTILQTSAVQSLIARKASSYFSELLGLKIEIKQVKISLMLDVMLRGVYVEDSHQHEMISVNYLYARLNSAQLLKKSFRINEVEMTEGGFSMIKYEGESFWNYTDLIGIPDTLREKSSDIAFDLSCRSVKLTNCHFNMVNKNREPRNGFDWNNMHLKLHKVDGRNLVVNNDSISVDIKNIAVADTSGFRLNKFTTTMKFLDDGWYFNNTFILTPESTLDFDFKMGYTTFDNIGNFVDSVTMIATVRPSILDIQDVAYFTETFRDYHLLADLETKFEGTLHDFSVNDFQMDFGENSQLRLDGHFQGILDIETALMNVRMHNLTTSWGDLQALNLPITFLSAPPPAPILKEPLSLILLFNGGIHDFMSDLHVSSKAGDIGAQLKLAWDESLQEHTYDALINTETLHVGYLANIPETLGDGSLNINISGSGLSLETAKIDVIALLDHLIFNDYQYNDIRIDGLFENKTFDGYLGIADDNIKLDFQGEVNLSDSLPAFDFKANIKNAYLTRLHLMKERSDNLRLSTALKMKAKGNSIDNMIGTVNVDNLVLVEDGEIYAVDSIHILSYQADAENRNTRIDSDLLNARINGHYQFSHIGEMIRQLLGNYLASISNSEPENFNLSSNIQGYIEIKDISPVTRFLFRN
ncbi:hypothetical protein LJB78_01060 [Bacteroidales bacterium OttesenSCG-928-J16]|nr:hypothetical protein [Bacteroidales bacterium OttesenSCG-928-J16]